MARAELEEALRDGSSQARVLELLRTELDRSRAELAKPRSGKVEPVTVAIAPGVVAVAPVDAAYRVDPDALNERELQVVAALEDALQEAGEHGEPLATEFSGHLALVLPGDAELAQIAFDEGVASVDRLRAGALLFGALEVRDPRPIVRPVADGAIRPHDDTVPARRVARRILQTLDRKGKWGGYHTDVAHLPRGFEGNDRQLATVVGEALLAAGLLVSKPSVGQRHVYLNPRRARDIHRLIEEGTVPADLTL